MSDGSSQRPDYECPPQPDAQPLFPPRMSRPPSSVRLMPPPPPLMHHHTPSQWPPPPMYTWPPPHSSSSQGSGYYLTQSALDPALQEATGPVVNADNTPSKRKAQKRKKVPDNTDTYAHSKRIRKARDRAENEAQQPPPVICGVGPSSSKDTANITPSQSSSPPPQDPAVPVPLPPSHAHQNPLVERTQQRSHAKRRRARQTKSAASDIWPFVYGLESETRHDIPVGPGTQKHPKSDFVGCKFCIDDGNWKVYRNSNNGLTTNLRKHFQDKHEDNYYGACLAAGYVSIQPTASLDSDDSEPTPSEPFKLDAFYDLLIDWVTVDDQSVNVIECPEFRRLLSYISPHLNDEDLVHRSKLTDLIFTKYAQVYAEMTKSMREAPGRVSFTFDAWSDNQLTSFLAVTAHYIAKDHNDNLTLKSHLLAFRALEGSHDGENIGSTFLRTVRDAGLLEKMGSITTDNASNNMTALQTVQRLTKDEIEFDAEGNHVGCFPHSSALGTSALMVELKNNPTQPILEYAETLEDPAERQHYIDYAQALAADPVGSIRSLVAACRASGQRRQDLRATIIEGQKSNHWESLRPGGIPILQLLRDCVTRWSSTYWMLDRALVLYPAIASFLRHPKQDDISCHALTDIKQDVAEDIHDILEKSADVQQLISAEITPTIAFTYPTYENLIGTLKDLKADILVLAHYIEMNILKLEEYFFKCRRSRVFALAILLRPDVKFGSLQKSWLPREAEQARGWLIEAMTAHRTAHRHQTELARTRVLRAAGPIAPVAAATASGPPHTKFTSHRCQRKSESLSQIDSAQSSQSLPEAGSDSGATTQNEDDIEAAELSQDRAICEKELTEYQSEPVVPIQNGGDLLRYWGCARERTKPYLYRVALDVLPAQASSVACERVFSSSKETDASRRNQTGTSLMEVLQVLKHNCKQERLALKYMDDLSPKEEDYSIEGPVTITAARELIAAGKFDELRELIANAEVVGAA